MKTLKNKLSFSRSFQKIEGNTKVDSFSSLSFLKQRTTQPTVCLTIEVVAASDEFN